MRDIYRHVASKIRELRTTFGGRGISQQELARKLHTKANAISRWETATYRPSLTDLEHLAEFFGVSVGVFFPRGQTDYRMDALISAAANLDDEDLQELIRYARYRKARAGSIKRRG